MTRLIVLLLMAAGSIRAQATFGSITGSVTDPAGGVVPNASIQVINQETGLVKPVVSDSSGNYEVTHLNPGLYSVVTRAPGFKRLEHRDIMLETAKAHPKVLTYPEPVVTLSRFSLYGLEFDLKAHVADIFDGGIVASDLRFTILKALEEKGITIAQPLGLIQPFKP